MALVHAVRKSDGHIVRIPEHWLDNPVLGAAFKRRPSDPIAVAERAANRRKATTDPAKAEKEN